MNHRPITLKYGCSLIMLLVSSSVGGQGVGEFVKDVGSDVTQVVFSEVERQAIEKYYEKVGWPQADPGAWPQDSYHQDDADSGKGKGKNKNKKSKKGKGNANNRGHNKGLPPGIAKKLERGGSLPPGIAKRDLPSDLQRRLPPPPTGYERAQIAGEVVLVELATGIISDIVGARSGADHGRTSDKVITRKPAKVPDAPTTTEKKPWWQIWK